MKLFINDFLKEKLELIVRTDRQSLSIKLFSTWNTWWTTSMENLSSKKGNLLLKVLWTPPEKNQGTPWWPLGTLYSRFKALGPLTSQNVGRTFDICIIKSATLILLSKVVALLIGRGFGGTPIQLVFGFVIIKTSKGLGSNVSLDVVLYEIYIMCFVLKSTSEHN